MLSDERGIWWLLKRNVNLRINAMQLCLLHYIGNRMPGNISKMRSVSDSRITDSLPVATLSLLIIAMSNLQHAPGASNFLAPETGIGRHAVARRRM